MGVISQLALFTSNNIRIIKHLGKLVLKDNQQGPISKGHQTSSSDDNHPRAIQLQTITKVDTRLTNLMSLSSNKITTRQILKLNQAVQVSDPDEVSHP